MLHDHQEVLVEAAASCTWDGFGEVCGRLVVYADPDGSLADDRVPRRGVSVRTHHDGTVTGTWCLEPVSGAAFKAALQRARHLKDALLAAQRCRCATAGCDAPLGWLEANHRIPWSRGGPTATHNGQILCAADNKAKRDRTHPGDLSDTPDASDPPERCSPPERGSPRATGDPPERRAA